MLDRVVIVNEVLVEPYEGMLSTVGVSGVKVAGVGSPRFEILRVERVLPGSSLLTHPQ